MERDKRAFVDERNSYDKELADLRAQHSIDPLDLEFFETEIQLKKEHLAKKVYPKAKQNFVVREQRIAELDRKIKMATNNLESALQQCRDELLALCGEGM